jgi:hypothetical protein
MRLLRPTAIQRNAIFKPARDRVVERVGGRELRKNIERTRADLATIVPSGGTPKAPLARSGNGRNHSH